MDHKLKIIDFLDKLRQKETANKEPFKARAYAIVIKNLKNYDKPIETIDDVKDIKGVGKKIHEKIEEILNTGSLLQAEQFNDKIQLTNDLTNIHGIGPVKAKELVEKNNIKSIEDLKQNLDLLNDKQKLGLKYYEDFIKRIPRAEMIKHHDFIGEALKRIDKKLKFEIVGSYRRGLKDSGDIDVIISHEDDPKNYDHIIKDLVKELKKESYLKDDFALGSHKYLGVCKLKRHRTFRRIDFLYATANVWPFSILYFTGDVNFNVLMRRICLEKNLSLSEYGFKENNKENKEFLKLPIYTEEDIFKHLGYKFIPPYLRNGNPKLFDEHKLD